MVGKKRLKLKYTPNKALNIVLLVLPFLGLFLKHVMYVSYLLGDNYYEMNFANAWQGGGKFIFLQLAVLAILVAITLLFRKNGRYAFAIGANIFVTVLMVLDVCYARFFNDLPSVLMIQTISFKNDSVASKGNEFLPFIAQDVLFLIDLILWTGIYCIARCSTRKRRKAELIARENESAPAAAELKKRKRNYATVVISAAVLLAFSVIQLSILPLINLGSAAIHGSIYEEAYESESARKESLAFTSLGYHMYDIFKCIAGSEKVLTERNRAEIEDFYRWNREDYFINEHFGELAGKNVIVLQLESFEGFIIGNKIQGQEITPNINQLLGSSYHFTNIFDQVGTGNSSDTDLMSLTSLLPASNVAAYRFFADNTYNSAPKILDGMGYTSTYYNSLKSSFWNYMPMVNGPIAFTNSDFEFDTSDKINTYISDGSMLKQVAEKMERTYDPSRNFYAHVILDTSHVPFRMPEQYCDLDLTGEIANHVLGDYFQAVHYTDKAVGAFVDTITASGIMDNSVLVLMGDHRGVHKYYPQEINKLSNAAYEDWIGKNYDAPLTFVVYDPDKTQGEIVETYGGQVDIMPTLMYLLGVSHDNYNMTAMGRSLVATKRNATVGSDERIYGVASDMERNYLNKMFRLSNKILKTNFFAER